MSNAFVMWSGGKDSHFALNRGVQAGIRPVLLVTFIDAETDLVLSRRIPPELIEEQAKLTGIPLLKVRANRMTYLNELRDLMFDLRSDGLTRGIFGDVHSSERRTWYEEQLADFQIRPMFPLWGVPPSLLVRQQIESMRSVIISVDRHQISESYLGRDLNNEFVEYLMEKNLDPGGENGEYQTFVCRSHVMESEIVLTHADRLATPQQVSLDIDYWSVR